MARSIIRSLLRLQGPVETLWGRAQGQNLIEKWLSEALQRGAD